MTPSSLTTLVSTIVAPVALITPTAILLGNFMNKYTSIALQMRQLAAEYRQQETAPKRQQCIRQQLRLFHCRIKAMWAASGALLMALLAFLVTVISLIFIHHTTRVIVVGALSIMVGLGFILLAIMLELYEIGLARMTTSADLADILRQPIGTEQG